MMVKTSMATAPYVPKKLSMLPILAFRVRSSSWSGGMTTLMNPYYDLGSRDYSRILVLES
ncbi:uncharacterized protein CIMG_13199 [Coccidioides immitis RS]|uniref:Uncharacterized protein n=1 Tax=Coccidioides immitis (strain RS) TaxID=246410 RepID=A0A0D8JV10_COCIM|nr:uncharacterized protein CIMG_13199 [Coccidioides immitis RS]KJF60766.1 hypothetical protein CIMG_13199 [Coccidioides immitis RS]